MNVLDYIIAKHHIDLDDESPHLLSADRWDYLPALFRELGFTVGAEVGVEKGAFSRKLCEEVPNLKLYSIDAWLSYGWYTSKAKYSQRWMEKHYQAAVENLAPFNCEVIRGLSVDVVKQFADNSLDFVFLDSNGGYDYAYQDIELWNSKVRSGGIFSGHDYFNSRVPGRCRVKDAVDDWTRENNLEVWFVIVGGRYPSYFWVKP